MINKKIAISSLSILAALSLMGGATFAAFSSSATSANNTFSAGTVALLLSDSVVNGGTAETDQATVQSSFGASGLMPGECTGPQTLSVENSGTIDGTVTVTGNNTNGAMSPYLRVASLTFSGDPVPFGTVNTNGNLFADLQDFAANSPLAAGALAAESTEDLVMDVCLDESAPNSLQGASNNFSLTVTLNQEEVEE
jgi:predicted ribosomally synthesized peptide with SipW-like signal peptide